MKVKQFWSSIFIGQVSSRLVTLSLASLGSLGDLTSRICAIDFYEGKTIEAVFSLAKCHQGWWRSQGKCSHCWCHCSLTTLCQRKYSFNMFYIHRNLWRETVIDCTTLQCQSIVNLLSLCENFDLYGTDRNTVHLPISSPDLLSSFLYKSKAVEASLLLIYCSLSKST